MLNSQNKPKNLQILPNKLITFYLKFVVIHVTKLDSISKNLSSQLKRKKDFAI